MCLFKGEKKCAKNFFKKGGIYNWAQKARFLRFQALFALVEGKLLKALELAQKALESSKGDDLYQDIVHSLLTIITAYAGLGEIEKIKGLVKSLIKFIRKVRLKRWGIIMNILTGKKVCINELSMLPTIRLAWLLRHRGYQCAYNYAHKNGIMFYFYRYLLFFPQIVQALIKRGKFTTLPPGILKLPLFNRMTIVYRVNFLGRLIVYRNQEYVRLRLKPKDLAFLIYLCQKAMEPKRSIDLNEVYNNFWPKSENASRNFSHLLVHVKKALKIPSHLLMVSRSYGETSLINEGIYFTTDYQEFEQTLARAKALQRTGEWGFAKKEFLQAFKLFRGEPFKKNFDEWSSNMRFKILTELETEAINFAKVCLEHGNKRDAKKVLEKVSKIIPDLEEIKNLSDSLIAE